MQILAGVSSGAIVSQYLVVAGGGGGGGVNGEGGGGAGGLRCTKDNTGGGGSGVVIIDAGKSPHRLQVHQVLAELFTHLQVAEASPTNGTLCRNS
jgi:hypothetical protein